MNAEATIRLPVPAEYLRHKVILASAGSGKTHELSGRYLSLLAAGAAPSTILASTFTRLAAGEIRDRLLQRLAESVDDAKKRAELAASLGLRSVSREQALGTLTALARNLHLLNVSTLDAFFARVVFAFAIELGLPLGASIVDEPDNQALRLEAIRLMLDEGKPDDMEAMIELLRLLTRGESERSVTRTIDRLVADLYEIWRETSPQAWECVPEIAGELSRTELVDALDRLAMCALPKDKHYADARQKELRAATSRDWPEFLKSGIAKKVLQNDFVYYRKSIPQGAIDAYRPLVAHAVAEIVGRLRDQTLATRDLLTKFHLHYETLKRQRRVITFSDLTHAMARAERNAAPLTEIFFRLDATLQHLLLDEFQDTSLAQWLALQPLAKEMTDNAPPERTFFCVGDVKQSIYVWRNANPDILERLPRMLPSVEQAALDKSWRSSPVVIGVINDVFGKLPDNPALQVRESRSEPDDDDSYAEAARLWRERFNTHEAAGPKQSLAGYVQMRFGPAREGKGRGFPALQKKIRLRAAALLVADLHRSNPRMRIALLTRTNDAVARLLYELGSDELGVPASGRGGGPLIDAPPVNVLLDALHLADHPEDTVAAFNIARSPLGEAIGFTDFAHAGKRRRFARETREMLLRDGYQRTIAKWVKAIGPACDARELRRAAQMVELAGVQDRRSADSPALRPGDFIALVEQKDVPDSQPAPVEVMTVHQAKGLEFDAVVLAELDMLLSGQDPAIVFDRDESTGEIARVCRWIGKEVRHFVPTLQPVIRQHRIRAIRESLSLLYVAMTRPRHALYMIVDPPSDTERDVPRNLGGVVRGALADGAGSPDTVVFETGDVEWWRQVKVDHDEDEKATVVCATIDRFTLARDPSTALRGEAAASPSMFAERAIARKQATALREQLQLRSPEARERGTVIHALFERIEWLEDFAIGDDALIAVARVTCPRRDDRWHARQVQAFRDMLRRPALAAALSRGKVDPSMIRLHREHPFARIERGLVQAGALDRLVLQLDRDGRPMGATVIDFKTDALDDRQSAAMARAQAETHRPQLEMYRDTVAEMFALPAEMVEMQVLLVGAGAVVDL